MKVRMLDGSGTRDYKYVIEDADRHGNVRIYFRIKSKKYKARMHEKPGTEAFEAEYQKHRSLAVNKQSSTSALSGTLRWLCQKYYTAPDFKRLDLRTQKVRRGILDNICSERFGKEITHGDKKFAQMQVKHARQIRDAKSDYPESANGRVKAMRQLFKWAIESGYTNDNPAREVSYFTSSSEGHHTWTAEEVRRYVTRHPLGTKAHLALALLLYTGVRRSDVVSLGPQMERDGWLVFTETKNRRNKPKLRELPILPELRAAIDAVPSGHLSYLVTAFGKPFTANGFGNWFKKRCREAGLDDHCSAHGLRKAGATFAANNGATTKQLMAIFGWETIKEADHYTRRVDQKHLAESAMSLLSPEQKMKTGVPLSKHKGSHDG